MKTKRVINKIAITKAAVIHIGLNTHTQAQLITLQSFKTINTIVSNPTKPIPPLVLLLSLLFDIFTFRSFLAAYVQSFT